MLTPPSPRPRAVLAGGGTGGHVFPALAVAEELLARGWAVSLVGRLGGLEERLAGEAGLPFHHLDAEPLVGRGWRGRIRALATLAGSALAARRLLVRVDARVVIGTGGFVSAPAVVGARLARRPVVLLEPNARAGVANRRLSRWAAEAAVAFPGSERDLRCPVRQTGVPVRQAFFAVSEELPPDRSPSLLVLGGSQGARQLNELLPAAVGSLASRLPGLQILHQAGPGNREVCRAAYRARVPADVRIEVVSFLDDVATAMAGAHLVVSRAGAVTLAEICAAGRPSVLIPLAIASGHQVENARALMAAGAAEVLTPGTGEDQRLAALLSALLSDRERLRSMARAARSLARPGAAAEIADRIEALGRVA